MIEAEDLSMEHKDVWNYLADGGLESYLIPGSTHFTIMNEPYIKLLSDKLNYFLDKAHSEIENESVVNVSESSVKDLAEEVNA